MSGEWGFETELAEMPSSSTLSRKILRKMEYNLWHPNQRPMMMGDDGATLPGRSTGQRRRGEGGRGGRASSDLGGHRVGAAADSGSRRPDGGDAVDGGGRMNRTEERPSVRFVFRA